MKASELIVFLERSVNEHGDVDVLIEDCGYYADTGRWFASLDDNQEVVDWSEVESLKVGNNFLSSDDLSARKGIALIIGKTFNHP